MTQILQTSTRIAAFGAACMMALAVNGAVLLGADQMASEGAQQQAACARQTVQAQNGNTESRNARV